MGQLQYSEPGFDPYSDQPSLSDAAGWQAPEASGPLAATVRLPGSKSLTNRELVLAALADGPSRLRSPLQARDTQLMVEGLRALGVDIVPHPDAPDDLIITPPAELTGSTTIACGLAGTVMRFLPAVAALALGPTVFDGDPQARLRPMSGVLAGLRAVGVDMADDGRGALPFTIHGTGRVAGGHTTIDASASSQFVSGLLLAAPRFDAGLTLQHHGEHLPSQPHIAMTVACVHARGVMVTTSAPDRWEVRPGPIAGADITIEPDLSNAAPFLIAPLLTGGQVTVAGFPEVTTQVGASLVTILHTFGAEVTREGQALTVAAGDGIRGVTLDLRDAGELVPNLVALAALASEPSTFTGIGHIRFHETDRLAALATELTALGGRVQELPDGLRIEPAPLHGGVWHAYADHRMATSGAILGLAVPGVVVDDMGCTSKTFPEFPSLWRRLLADEPV